MNTFWPGACCSSLVSRASFARVLDSRPRFASTSNQSFHWGHVDSDPRSTLERQVPFESPNAILQPNLSAFAETPAQEPNSSLSILRQTTACTSSRYPAHYLPSSNDHHHLVSPPMQNIGKSALRVAKNSLKGYSEYVPRSPIPSRRAELTGMFHSVQTKVRDATSNDPWGPSGTQYV